MTGEAWAAEVQEQLDGATTRVEVLRIAVGFAVDVETDAERQKLQDLTLARLQEVDTVAVGTEQALWRVKAERQRQGELGYTADHDDQHGVAHLVDEALLRLQGRLWTRDELVQASALLVAAVEWLDRAERRHYPEEPSA